MNFITELFLVACDKQTTQKNNIKLKRIVLICHIYFQPYSYGDYLSTRGITQFIYSSTYLTLGLDGNKFKTL